jgi:uncharacterized membrane protein YjjP (DUF1212 family)
MHTVLNFVFNPLVNGNINLFAIGFYLTILAIFVTYQIEKE